ncbi:MAG: methyl-accepting chemotaxis protein [Synergistaceae bacterium]|nr:methyl-accepting chemotaxis protein [Synergistaceae bacterium]
MSTKSKLILSFTIVIAINAGFALYSIRSLSTIYGRVVEVYSWTEGVWEVGDMQFSAATVRMYDLNYVFQTETAERENTFRRRSEEIEKLKDMLDDYKNDVLTIPYDTEEQRQDDLRAIDDIIGKWNTFHASSEQIIGEAAAGRNQRAVEIIKTESSEFYAALEGSIKGLSDFNRTGSEEVMEMSGEIYQATKRTIIAILAVVSTFSIALPVFLIRGINRSIDELLRVSESVGGGDLTVKARVFAEDEFGKLSRRYNQTIDNIKSLVSAIQNSTAHMAESAEDFRGNAAKASAGTALIAQSVGKVSLQSDKQRFEIESITGAIGNITGGIANATEKLDALASDAAGSVGIAQEGGEFVRRAVEQMRVIESAVNTSSEIITELGDRSNEIGRIVESISDISSQTNLLALNAAIESARAGEHGRGFAVVAEEVKKLAGESQSAADEISHLISRIQEETAKAVEAMACGREETKRGTVAVSDCGRAFGDLAQRSVDSSETLQGMSSVMHEMLPGATGLLTAIRNVEDSVREIVSDSRSIVTSTEGAASSMSEVSERSQTLAGVASKMLETTRRFSV